MGSGDWFRSVIGLKRVKGDKSKRTKVHSATEKSNGVDAEQSNNLAGGSSQDYYPGVHGMSVEEVEKISAIRIQNAFRAHMARKTFCRARKAERFNNLVQGHIVKKQTSSALGYIHSWFNIQDQIRARRLCMVTQGRIRQKQLENQLKLEAKLNELEVDWCGGSETMEEILAKIQQREEAAVKRERAMAYAFSHQWRANATQYLGQASFSLGKENWGWSWKERWIAARPWEIRVHTQLTNPKKSHSRQASKSDNKFTKQQEIIKVSGSVKPALSNGKETTKAKKVSPSKC